MKVIQQSQLNLDRSAFLYGQPTGRTSLRSTELAYPISGKGKNEDHKTVSIPSLAKEAVS